jgi:hypothetical protein
VESDQPSSVPQRFVHDLTQLRQRAGRPSYSTLERLSSHRLRRATVSDVLNGNRVGLPDWRFVAVFVAACRAAAEESGLDANELGTIADWKRHWDSASSGLIDARFPGHVHQLSAVREQSPVPPQEPADEAVRPGPSVWGPLPSRLPDFVGRTAWLDALRHALAKDDRASAIAVQGMFGVGKTQLVLEYAHRHAHEYDLVWWIQCDDTESAHAAMADLAAALGLTEVSQRPEESDFTELFDVLRRSQRYGRWLLIFDNVNEPEEIQNLIPPLSGGGHVLVTTRSSRWEASGDLIELDVFDRAESTELLRRRMPKLSAASAHRLAEGVGDLPLMLEHAVESNMTVDVYLARLDSDPLGLLDDQPADYQATVAGQWRAVLDQLRADAPDALHLLCCLAFFGCDPVPRESLERGSYFAEISIHAVLRDPFKRLSAIRKLRRAGLLRVRADDGSFEVHRVTRCVVRDMVARSGAADEERARHDVHLLLAAADPLTPDDPSTWRSYGELRGHAAEADIAACSEEIVRKFVVNLVRFLNAAGDPRAALTMADGVLARWGSDSADSGAQVTDSDVAMRVARADALSAYGRHAEAFRVRQQVAAAMRIDPGRWAAEVIQLDVNNGAHLRVTGKFSAALAADRQAVTTHAAEFGDDDPRTFTAVGSLITDLVLNGLTAEATDAAGRLFRDCLVYYSDAGHPAVLAARNIVGRCLWLSGWYGEAVEVLAEVHAGYGALAEGGVLSEIHPWHLAHEIDYAAARWDKGLLPADIRPLAEGMQDVRRRSWGMLGAGHPLTLAATVVLGSLLRRIDGRAGEAARLLTDAVHRYHSTLPDHPYGHACAGFLATVRSQAANGNPRRAAAQSVPVIQGAAERLAKSIGQGHPLSLTVASMEANALARAGDLDAALKRGHETLAGFQSLLGTEHPHALAVEANAVTAATMLGRAPATEDLRTRIVAAIGPDHPDLALFDRGKLIDIDFTPLPL